MDRFRQCALSSYMRRKYPYILDRNCVILAEDHTDFMDISVTLDCRIITLLNYKPHQSDWNHHVEGNL